jgi:hypothetical protein
MEDPQTAAKDPQIIMLRADILTELDRYLSIIGRALNRNIWIPNGTGGELGEDHMVPL